MKKSIIIIIVLMSCLSPYFVYSQVSSQKQTPQKQEQEYPKALVDYEDFKNLVAEVEKQRATRLISLDAFIKMSSEQDVVILDTRSDALFKSKHIKGAIHLDFTDFTQENLNKLIPNPYTKILIYCNNNFLGDQVNFASKVSLPKKAMKASKTEKPIMLALNIPTYINLYGYGYRNIYELYELVYINDPRITFEGTDVN